MASPATKPSSARPRETENAIQHVEITSTKPARLREFLEQQFGWEFETQDLPGDVEYHMFRTPDGNGGGVQAVEGERPPAATPYINVRDIDAKRDSLEAAGARILTAVEDVPGAGRFFWFQVEGAPALACWESER